eukprot:Awhi_evm1s6160
MSIRTINDLMIVRDETERLNHIHHHHQQHDNVHLHKGDKKDCLLKDIAPVNTMNVDDNDENEKRNTKDTIDDDNDDDADDDAENEFDFNDGIDSFISILQKDALRKRNL